MKHVIKWRTKLHAAAITVTSAHIRCVRSFFVSSSCYVTAPLAMYIKSEAVGGGGWGGGGGGGAIKNR